ncbi:MAG: hypothetical protein J2P49_01515 [Methylocapsa sp.]|nr:hypothetical protein [Methylocapsa sp.]
MRVAKWSRSTDRLQTAVAGAAREAELIAATVALPENIKFQRARAHSRGAERCRDRAKDRIRSSQNFAMANKRRDTPLKAGHSASGLGAEISKQLSARKRYILLQVK